jgi:hypothetical protein
MNRLLALTFTSLALLSCGHLNRLGDYPVFGSRALYQARVAPQAFDAEVWITPPPQDTASPREVRWIVEIARTAGEVISTAEASRKLREAIVPEELAQAAASGFQQAAQTYLRLSPVRSLEDEPPFVVETILEEYRLISSGFGINAKVRVRSRILHRPSAEVIWENSKEASIPLQKTTAAGLIPGASTVASALNAARLLSMKSHEIRQILEYAARQAGEKLGESLRKDVAKLPRKGS